MSPPELLSRLGDAQLRPLHKFGQHLPPMALHSLSCRHLGVQLVTFVDEGQSASGQVDRQCKLSLVLHYGRDLPPAASETARQAPITASSRSIRPGLATVKERERELERVKSLELSIDVPIFLVLQLNVRYVAHVNSDCRQLGFIQLLRLSLSLWQYRLLREPV